jgi:hypothetical protein
VWLWPAVAQRCLPAFLLYYPAVTGSHHPAAACHH